MLIAPIVLAILVVGIFFFPNVLGHYIIRPAMASVFPSFTGGDYLGQTISAWHGFNTEVWMTIGVIVLGSFLYMFLRYWKNVYKLFPANLTLDNLYNHTLEQMEKGSAVFTSFYMTGSLRHYLLYIYLFFIAAIGGILLYTGAFDFSMAGDAAVSLYDWIITFVVLTSGVSILSAISRLIAILLNIVIVS